MQKRWIVKPHDDESALRLQRELGISGLAARVLAARGYTSVLDAGKFIKPSLTDLPDPLLIPGMGQAIHWVCRAVEEKKKIWVYTDYDADGVTSAALLVEFFEALGCDCEPWIPRRDREGYGLHVEPLEEMAKRGGGLVVTADCGITAFEPALAAKKLGLRLVITDHHTPSDTLPEADAVVNPKLCGTGWPLYPDDMIAGVGVAWNLTAAVRRELRNRGYFKTRTEPRIENTLPLVALGSVADIVPLRKVNRIFVTFGLKQLNNGGRQPGFAALAAVAGVKGDIGAGHLGFQLGPRINAAGRMEGPEDALKLLRATSVEQAEPFAAALDRLNQERRAEEAAILGKVVARVEERGYMPERCSLVVEGEGFHHGVVGIVAARLVERYYRPSIVLSVDGENAKGSARSIPGIDLHAALSKCAFCLERFGGHKAAAGLALKTENIEVFREVFEATIAEMLEPDSLIPVLEADTEISGTDLTVETVSGLEALSPFGAGNSTPLFVLKGMKVIKRSTMGEEGKHLRLDLTDGLNRVQAVGWSMGGAFDFAQAGTTVDLMCKLGVREYNGVTNTQIVVEDAKLSGQDK